MASFALPPVQRYSAWRGYLTARYLSTEMHKVRQTEQVWNTRPSQERQARIFNRYQNVLLGRSQGEFLGRLPACKSCSHQALRNCKESKNKSTSTKDVIRLNTNMTRILINCYQKKKIFSKKMKHFDSTPYEKFLFHKEIFYGQKK